jgi:glycoside/pentoside/hexuronide:cation symporter, GPH family
MSQPDPEPLPLLPRKADEGLLTAKQKLAYGTGYWSVILANKGVDEFAKPVYNIILGLNPALVGIVLTLQRAWDAITDPLIGHWSDNSKCRWGRRRPFMASGAVLTAISFTCLWLASPAWSDGAKLSYFVGVGLLFVVSATLMIVPYHALGFELTDHPQERTRLMGWKALFLHLGIISAGWLFALASLPMWSSPAQGVLGASIAAGVVIAITMMIPAVILQEPQTPPRRNTPVGQARVGLVGGLRQLSHNRPFVLLTTITGVIFFAFQSVGVLNLYVNIYYVHEGNTARGAVMHGIWTTVYHVVAAAIIPVVIGAANRFGKRETLLTCLLIALVANVLKWWCYRPEHPWTMLLVALVLAPGYSAFWLLQASMMGDVCDYDRWKSGQSRSGLVSALISWVQKAAGSIALLLSGFILVWVGFNRDLAGEQGETTLVAMRLLFAVVPALGIIISIYGVIRYPLDQKTMAMIRRELHDPTSTKT